MVLLLLTVFGCSQSDRDLGDYDDYARESDATFTMMTYGTSVTRMMIYEGDISVSTENVEETFNAITALLEEDEWIETQSLSDDFARLRLRIDSTRLDEFTTLLRDDFNVIQVDITAEDITKAYQDAESEIATYEAEKTRLLELYEEASLSEMITINTRISVIDQALNILLNAQEDRESDVLYSSISIVIREENVFEELPFGTEVSDAFLGGWNALISFFQTIILVVIVLIPWMILIIPIGLASLYYFKKHPLKSKKKPAEIEKS